MSAAAPERGLVVFSDLDGCLLDERSYSWEPARPALQALATRGVPLVLCSSKTRAEMAPLVRALDLRAPFIVENGGALVFPEGAWPAPPAGASDVDGLRVEPLGVPAPMLRQALDEIAGETGAQVLALSALAPERVAALTGLPPAEAELALQREFSEPFLFANGDVDPGLLAQAARRRGLRLTRGGRFWHLGSPAGKGGAARRVLALCAAAGSRPFTVGLGDAPNDLPLLQAVDHAILVPRPDGRVDEELAGALPGAERAPAPGPAGWNAAVLGLLRSRA